MSTNAADRPLPAATDVDGLPLMVGARLASLETTIENAGSERLTSPSVTRIRMLLYVPTCAAEGVPVNRPVAVLNVAQAGLFCTENVSRLPSGSDAVTLKFVVAPTGTVWGPVMAISGARLLVGTMRPHHVPQ